ncbi:hypothetical protein [Pelagibacterium limicola]|uniref:hypothetical protein n=1 Tax=Pelagibacterium limicola TaxID=2791022 RepID=UPI001A9B96F0|nr:hypothetical protein [Pelagibacterium limicola]
MVSILASILTKLCSYQTAWKAANLDIQNLDAEYRKHIEAQPSVNKHRMWTSRLNTLSFWLFALGTLAICAVAFTNIGE